MPDQPDVVTATLLENATTQPELYLGQNLFRGPVRPQTPGQGVPHCAVFCLATGGPIPEFYLNDPATCPYLRSSNVQVTVRSDDAATENSFANGQALARDCYQALQNADPTSISEYVMFDVLDSEPVYLGQDDTEHHRWVINLQIMRRNF